MEFSYALIVSSFLTFAVTGLEFESGGPTRYVLPFIPLAFVFTYWLQKKAAYFAIAGSAISASYFFLGAINTALFAVLIAAYVYILTAIKKTSHRILAALLLTAVLAVLRIGFMNLVFIPLAVPVVGSMIMFRYVLMLYEYHYGNPQATWIQKFTYLVLPPALAFPLFPIVDYKSFLNNHRPQDAAVIRTGLTRIMAGLVFMMTYRILYLYFIPGYVEVHDTLSAFIYIISNYLYILNVVGVMWIASGYLGLLGFDLPQVFNYVFLIDSFSDIWRRINIYWRDFVVKIFYYPIYFKLRKRTKAAILIASLITLTISALMHGWQWFWLQGTFVFNMPGILFWSVLGLVISINLAMQNPNETAPHKPNVVVHAMRITGMFLFMSFMWSLWNSSSLNEWLNLLSYFGEGNLKSWGIILSVLSGIFVMYLFILRLPQKPAGHHFLNQPRSPIVIFSICVLLAVPLINGITGPVPGKAGAFIASISESRLTKVDESAATENYYNRMLASDGMGMRPWEMHTPGRDARSGLDDACVRSENLLLRELIPNKVTVLDGWTITANSFGMRDKEYSIAKPEGVYRIAILGASFEMGSGVAQDSSFEALLEQILNDSLSPQKIEVLNFAVGGYHLPQLVWVAENKLPPFQPDLVLCFVHPADIARTSDYMANLVRNGIDLHYPELYQIRKEAGAEQRMDAKVLVNRFYPYSSRIANWSIFRIREASDSMHAKFGMVYIPSFAKESDADFYRNMFTTPAEEVYPGLPKPLFFDLADIFAGREEHFQLTKDPTHPNSKGHQLIAEELGRQLSPAIRSFTKQQP
jgi:hypothetical protein